MYHHFASILKVYEMYETKNHFFIVTDLYSGGDLFSELEDNGCFNEFEAAELMNAMLMCMNYCHKRNLVHLVSSLSQCILHLNFCSANVFFLFSRISNLKIFC